MKEIVERLLQGDRRALSRLITMIENRTPGTREALRQLHPHTGRAHIIGITGAPGTGKSTLVNQLVRGFRQLGRSVGVIAVDPTSPFTGGALLGDRVRMTELSSDPGVFIRSMATRGHLGGLAEATAAAVRALDAFGCQLVIVETVGVGQDEVEIASTAHTVVVVTVPGLGDEIQVIKAGILEIADLFVVNKSDKENAARLVSELEMLQTLRPRDESWTPPILQTVATTGQGIGALIETIQQHKQYLEESGLLPQRLRQRAREELIEAIKEEFGRRLFQTSESHLEMLVEQIATGQLDPHTAAERILNRSTVRPIK
ncbi:MAG: methylmalonyl Co-A mutase-associated GTPase MeaB [Chloroflexi bacterium]|nr:methylmalonyl Co-A mutase-associated GTPase MeaB [Chloroflexota bacterium]MCL5074791.1 methylmalonyl Co-A mutase-associated GTPase MeaB [Chloroflexota bacterium]